MFEFQVKSDCPNQLPFIRLCYPGPPTTGPWGGPTGGFCVKSHFLFGAEHFLQVTHRLPLASRWEAKEGVEAAPAVPPSSASTPAG